MSEYLPSFIVEPVLRQARRFSRLSGVEEAPSFLPAVPESFRTWTTTRLWSTSPPPSLAEEDQQQEGTLQLIARNIQLWRNQVPSPPLEAMEVTTPEEIVPSDNVSTTQFPNLETSNALPSRPQLETLRSGSETSLNPLRELPDRSRRFEDDGRVHSRSDPTSGTRSRGQTITNLSITTNTRGEDVYQRRDGKGALPEDDGMGPLRQRINAVWAGSGTAAEKSRLIHTLMMERYRLAQSRSALGIPGDSINKTAILDRPPSPMSLTSGASQEAVFNLTEADLAPTFVPKPPQPSPQEGEDTDHGPPEESEQNLGCFHYKRNVKMQCYDCERWYTCRLCHDEAESHVLPRRQTKNMLCMLCNTPQRASDICRMCGQLAARYYCAVCKLWSDDPEKAIYHCDDCGICRLGQGLGKDFFHCKTCAACMSISAEPTHRCIEKSTQCDCPICGEYLFTSNKSVAFMRCGHAIHEICFADWCKSGYKCPVCSKSVTNMESQFRRLDRHIAEQPMPAEYSQTQAYVFCNDCLSRCTTSYHWLGLKCQRCDSYNTVQLQLINPTDAQPSPHEEGGRQPAEASMTAASEPDFIEPSAASPSDVPHEQLRRPSAYALRALSPSSAAARSPSPVVGSYFGTGSSRNGDQPRNRVTTPLEEDEDLDFWGGQSPTSPRSPPLPPATTQRISRPQSEGSSSESSDEDETMHAEDDVDEGEDELDIFGHR